MLKVFKAGESIDGFERGARAFVGGVVGAATGDGPVSLKQQVSSASRATQRRDVTHEEECCSILCLGKMLQKYNGGMRTSQNTMATRVTHPVSTVARVKSPKICLGCCCWTWLEDQLKAACCWL